MPFNVEFGETIIETESAGIHRRFEVARMAQHDIIYVQDDDAVVDIKALWTHYDGRLTNFMTPYHQSVYGPTGVTLIGWGCFFPKRLLDFNRWTTQFGPIPEHEDDRVFSYEAQPHNTIVTVSGIKQLHRPRAMSRDNPRHYQNRDMMFRRLKELK